MYEEQNRWKHKLSKEKGANPSPPPHTTVREGLAPKRNQY